MRVVTDAHVVCESPQACVAEPAGTRASGLLEPARLRSHSRAVLPLSYSGTVTYIVVIFSKYFEIRLALDNKFDVTQNC